MSGERSEPRTKSERAISRISSLPLPPPSTSLTSTPSSLLSDFIIFIKRTFQPSQIRKKRKTGFLARTRTKDGRKTLERRLKKGRKELSA
ncbi:hypothetical protein TrLO_g853 [Triparma laevis f. longispina]|uniref:Large ribosomal subunit protein bL34m n=1 Tax=Triparma laevis f. longispina TaxID=1714387 RepID=A0A9W7FSB5_9STRA|nr:hypothetical protein TrLO_g853 [Triparma laevis f. longispina]